jgi:hypothetical protein
MRRIFDPEFSSTFERNVQVLVVPVLDGTKELIVYINHMVCTATVGGRRETQTVQGGPSR